MDRDLERAKQGLDAIESHTQLLNDARMVRIRKAVKTGNLCAAPRRAHLLTVSSRHSVTKSTN